jgi:ABC-type bacteriocin/lantibiotic exporter with double-glycine peptidase domain
MELAAAYLERTLNPRAPLPARPHAPGRITELVTYLSKRCNFHFSPATVNEEDPLLKQMVSALEASQVRARKVHLVERWWEFNQPVLVVEGDRGLDVILPGPNSAPYLHRMGSDPIRVDEKIAHAFSRDALEVIRPLNPGRLTLADLIRVSVMGMRRDFVISITSAVLVGIISLAIPLATELIFSDVVPTGDVARLVAISAALLSLTVAAGAFTYSRTYNFVRIGDATEMATGGAVLDRLLRLPAQALAAWPSARAASRVTIWSPLVSSLDYINIGLISVMLVLLNGSLLIWFIPSLGTVAVVLGLILLAASWLIIRRDNAIWHIEMEAHSKLEVTTTDLMRGWIPIRTSNGEIGGFTRWAKTFAAYRTAFNTRWTRQFSVEILVVGLLSAMTILFIVIAYRLPAGTIPASSFVAFLSAFGQFSIGLVGLILTMRAFEAVRPHVERLAELLGSETEESERSEDPGPLTGALEVRRVGFRYGPDLPWVVRDISFQAEPGDFVAIVGTSGSGKSTLLRLLLGFENPQTGIVAFDEQDLASLNRSAVRRQCGVVLQSSLLLAGTIRENVTVASGPLPDARIWELLDQVSLADSVSNMAAGLDTWIDENATLISGGQRQRLLLARALAHDPKYLFLDEATSALDNITQEAITRSIASLDVTRIVIAHRLSTIRQADHIIVLDAGRMAEQGTFDELSTSGGIFAELISRQEL